MIVDGKQIAEGIYREIKNEISHMPSAPHLTICTCAPNFATQKYLAMKKRRAEAVGIQLSIIEFPPTTTTTELVQSIERMAIQTDGIVVQLPLPSQIDTEAVLAAIPASVDVDQVNYDGSDESVLPPVVGAIAEVAHRHEVIWAGQHIVVVGSGRLVGAPAARWAAVHGWSVTVLDKDSSDTESQLATADIIILGAGQPNLVRPDMVKDGVVLFDAGTSETGGKLVGDVHPECAEKASLFTPVPGGIGPVTIAVLLRNLIRLTEATR